MESQEYKKNIKHKNIKDKTSNIYKRWQVKFCGDNTEQFVIKTELSEADTSNV